MVSKCFLVIGPPRSGTSLVAGILEALGVKMRDDTNVEAYPGWNPSGSFVDVPLHCALLSVVNNAPDKAAAVANIQATITARQASGLWGVKDHSLFPIMSQFVALVTDPIYVIATSRTRAQGLASFQGVRGLPDDAALFTAMSTQATTALSLFTTNILTVNFAERFAPIALVQKIATFVGVSPTEAAAEFVLPVPANAN